MKKYIYLDWNIFKYLKSDETKYDSLREAVLNVGRGYILPYSEAHMYDLLSNYDESKLDYVKSDLKVVTKYTRNIIVGEDKTDGEFDLKEHEPLVIFNHIYELGKNDNPRFNISDIAKHDPNGSFKVDMDKMDKTNPLYDMLLKTDGWYIPEIAASYSASMFYDIFEEKDPYRAIRNAVQGAKEAISNNDTLVRNQEIDDYIARAEKFLKLIEIKDIEELKSKFMEGFEGHMSLTGKSVEDLSMRDRIGNAYALLDFHPLFQEKIKNNRASNMSRDSVHAYYAMKAKYFVSFDNKTIEKTNFVYEILGIDAKAIHMDDFVKKFR